MSVSSLGVTRSKIGAQVLTKVPSASRFPTRRGHKKFSLSIVSPMCYIVYEYMATTTTCMQSRPAPIKYYRSGVLLHWIMNIFHETISCKKTIFWFVIFLIIDCRLSWYPKPSIFYVITARYNSDAHGLLTAERRWIQIGKDSPACPNRYHLLLSLTSSTVFFWASKTSSTEPLSTEHSKLLSDRVQYYLLPNY